MINNPQSRFRLVAGGALIATVAVLLCFFPPVRVVDRESAKLRRDSKAFNASEIVDAFWREKLGPAIDAQATDAAELLALAERAPAEARDRYAKRPGVGTTSYYFVRGTGRIVSLAPDSLGVALSPDGKTPDVVIPLGRVFGNAARDGLGAFDVNDYQNSQEFNKLSAELNKRIEADVLPGIRGDAAKPGATIEFAGCVEVADEKAPPRPLRIVPVKAAFR